MKERAGNIVKIKSFFRFHDESGQYKVHIIPFIFKTIFCVIALLSMLSIAIELPSSIRDEIRYSGKEYYLSRCEEEYLNRDYPQLYDTLYLYDLYDEEYDKYWEIVQAYEDYALYQNYKKLVEEGKEQISIKVPENEEEYKKEFSVEFNAKELCDKYYKKITKDIEKCKFPQNERYLNEMKNNL